MIANVTSRIGGASSAGLNAIGVQLTMMAAEAASDVVLDYMAPPVPVITQGATPKKPRRKAKARENFGSHMGDLLYSYTLPAIAYSALRSGIGAISHSVLIGLYGTAAVVGVAKSVRKHL